MSIQEQNPARIIRDLLIKAYGRERVVVESFDEAIAFCKAPVTVPQDMKLLPPPKSTPIIERVDAYCMGTVMCGFALAYPFYVWNDPDLVGKTPIDVTPRLH